MSILTDLARRPIAAPQDTERISPVQVASDIARFVFLLALIPFLPLVLIMPEGETRNTSSGYDRKTQAEHDEAGAFWGGC